MDSLQLLGMEFYGHHGVSDAEREAGTKLTVDVRLGLSTAPGAATDRLEDTVDYVAVYDAVRVVLEGAPCKLLETVAERTASSILASNAGVDMVQVKVSKRPPLPGAFDCFGVEICRQR